MKKHFDIYIPKIEYISQKQFFFYGEKAYVTSATHTLPDREIHPEPRVLDLRNNQPTH